MWEDVQVRVDHRGYHYLLQKKRNEQTGDVKFRNVPMDRVYGKLFFNILVHDHVDFKAI